MFNKLKQGADGRYYARVTEQMYVQVNGVKLLSSFKDADAVTLEFSDSEKIKLVDQDIINAAKENSTEWFGKVVSDKTLEAGYTGSITNSVMIADKAVQNGECAVRGFKPDRTILDVTDIEEGSECDVVLEFAGINFFKKNYSPQWKIVQVKLKHAEEPKRNKYTDECLFEPEEQSETISDDEL
jgi:hypothetical protein